MQFFQVEFVHLRTGPNLITLHKVRRLGLDHVPLLTACFFLDVDGVGTAGERVLQEGIDLFKYFVEGLFVIDEGLLGRQATIAYDVVDELLLKYCCLQFADVRINPL